MFINISYLIPTSLLVVALLFYAINVIILIKKTKEWNKENKDKPVIKFEPSEWTAQKTNDSNLRVNKIKEWHVNYEKNSYVIFNSENRGFITNRDSKRFIFVLIFSVIIIGMIFASPAIFANHSPIVSLYIYCGIAYLGIALYAGVLNDRRKNAIDYIKLSSNTLEIKLLNKKYQTEPDKKPIVYLLNEIDIKYLIKIISSNNDIDYNIWKSYYVVVLHYSKPLKYYLWMNETNESNLISFVTYANIIKMDVDFNKLSDIDIKTMTEDSKY